MVRLSNLKQIIQKIELINDINDHLKEWYEIVEWF